MAIAWSPELSVGWGDLDDQHREIIRAIGEVQDRIGGADSAGAGAALAVLLDAVVRHFSAEEALMERWRYPERNAHKRSHDLFLHDLMALVQEHGEDGLTPEIADWALGRVPEWFTFHIRANDTPLGRFLASRHPVGRGPHPVPDDKTPRT